MIDQTESTYPNQSDSKINQEPEATIISPVAQDPTIIQPVSPNPIVSFTNHPSNAPTIIPDGPKAQENNIPDEVKQTPSKDENQEFTPKIKDNSPEEDTHKIENEEPREEIKDPIGNNKDKQSINSIDIDISLPNRDNSENIISSHHKNRKRVTTILTVSDAVWVNRQVNAKRYKKEKICCNIY